MDQISLIKMASAMARNATIEHRVIAENVANADTPGYEARTVKSFSEYLNEPFTPRATRSGHMGADLLAEAAYRPHITVDRSLEKSPNGNTVSLEDQAMRAVAAKGEHAMAQVLYRKTIDILRLGLGRKQ